MGCASPDTTYADRATLCPTDTHVCTAQEWMDNRDGAAPTYNYWTDDDLRYN